MKRILSMLSLSAAMAAHLMGQAAAPAPSPTAALEAGIKNAQLSADNAWMLVSCALVLMMTGPGLALFYGGLVRRKNVLGTMMQSFILMAIGTVLAAFPGRRRKPTSPTSDDDFAADLLVMQ